MYTEQEDRRLMSVPHGFVPRRPVLRGLGVGAASVMFASLIGCDDSDSEDQGTPASSGSASTAAITTTGQRPDELPDGWIWDPELPFPYKFPEPAKEAKPGGRLTVAVSWDLGPMDPVVSSAGGSVTVPNNIYNRLIGTVGGVHVDPFKFELESELAASWERSPDGLVQTFRFADGIKWQNVPPMDGRDFVAADAKFAFDRYRSTGVHQSYWTSVTSIEAVDPKTLKVTLSKPLVDFVIPLSSPYQLLFPHELVDDGSIATVAIGTGPMILKEAAAANHVVLEKNPDYWEREILLDSAEFKIMPDAAARVAAFRAEQVEFAYAPVTTEADVRALIDSNPDIQVNMTPQTYCPQAAPGFNLRNPKYADVRVRRAVKLATDLPGMMQVIWGGLAKALPTIPWIFAFDEEPTAESGNLGQWARHAPDEAKKLLQAAGAENLTIDGPYYEYDVATTARMEIMVDQLREVGIEFKPVKADYTQYNSMLHTGSWPDALGFAYYPNGFDADTFFFNQIHSKSPGNRDHLTDSHIDGWAEAQQVELDPQKRRELHRKIWDQLLDQAYRPISPTGLSFVIYQPWLRGIRFGGAVGNNSYFYDWGNQVAEAWLDK